MLDYDIFLESSLSHYQQKTTSLRRSPTKHEIENNPKKQHTNLGKVLKNYLKSWIFFEKKNWVKSTSRILHHTTMTWDDCKALTFQQPGDTTSIEGWSTAQGQLLGQDLATSVFLFSSKIREILKGGEYVNMIKNIYIYICLLPGKKRYEQKYPKKTLMGSLQLLLFLNHHLSWRKVFPKCYSNQLHLEDSTYSTYSTSPHRSYQSCHPSSWPEANKLLGTRKIINPCHTPFKVLGIYWVY